MKETDVSLVGCASYDRQLVESNVGRAFDLLGGPGEVAGRGSSVFIKVNGLIPAEPEKAITTHPEVVRAVVRQFKKVTDDITIGDSPGGPFNQAMLKRLYAKCGYAAVAEDTGASLNFDTSVSQVTVPLARSAKSITVCAAMERSDHLVSVSKLKTHMFMNVTCAIKNLFGAVPGMAKVVYHTNFCREKDFADLIVDVLLASGACFHVVDAVVGQDGNGPRQGNVKELGFIAAGSDAVALDTAMMHLIDADPSRNKPLAAAIDRGLGSGRFEDLRILGDDAEALAVRGFALPSKKDLSSHFPDAMKEAFGRRVAMRPHPDPARCTTCAKCVEFCPAGAMAIVDRSAVVDLKTCVKCYCCHELCEFDAIDLDRPLLLKVTGRLMG